MKFMRSRPRSIPPKQTPKHTSEAYPLDKPSSGDTVFPDEHIYIFIYIYILIYIAIYIYNTIYLNNHNKYNDNHNNDDMVSTADSNIDTSI